MSASHIEHELQADRARVAAAIAFAVIGTGGMIPGRSPVTARS